MSPLTPLERAFINRYQGGVPLVTRPYREMGRELGTTESELLEAIRSLLDRGLLTRFGPSFDAARLEGELTLAAMAVPEERFDWVAGIVNTLPAVAHNYRRDHALNMWFVISTLESGGIARTIGELESATGLPVHDFPKQREFYLGLWLHLDEDGRAETIPAPPYLPAAETLPAPDEGQSLAIIQATQSGFPLVEEPFTHIGDMLAMPPWRIIEAIREMLVRGAIRRIGAFPNHYRLGLKANGMTVWDIPDDEIPAAGNLIGGLGFVSHCYERPRHPGLWPYNLFAMVHGHDRDEVLAKTARIADLLGHHFRGHETLFSTAILKKSGLRVAA